MKLRIKVVLVVLLVFGVLFFAVSKVLTKIELENFQNLENKSVNENVGRVKAAVDGRSDDLAVQLTNWSQWDETFAFLNDGNQEFIDENFVPETFKELHLNFIVMKNKSGEIMFKRYLNNDLEEISFPSGIEKVFVDLKVPAIPDGELQARVSGIVNSADGPYVVAIQSVMTSVGGEIPAEGYIAFGYKIDDAFSASLSAATYLKMDFSSYDQVTNVSAFNEAYQNLSSGKESYIEKSPNPDVINGFVLIADIFQNPAVIFRAQISRDIYAAGIDNIKRLNMLLVGIEILQIVLILILLEIFVLRKIDKLSKGVQVIGAGEDGLARLEVVGKDEFCQLSLEINKMLDAISEIKSEKKESETRFLSIADISPVMIWISDSKNKIVYVNKSLMNFIGKSEDELFGDAWLKVVHQDDVKMVVENYTKASEAKQPFSMKYRVMTTKDEYRWIHVEAVARITAQGIFKGYTGTAVDVTNVEESDLQRKKHLEEIDRMNALMLESELKMSELKSKLKEGE